MLAPLVYPVHLNPNVQTTGRRLLSGGSEVHQAARLDARLPITRWRARMSPTVTPRRALRIRNILQSRRKRSARRLA